MDDHATHLTRASVRVLLLAVLADGPRYGYAIQRRLDALTGIAVPWAKLYPLLHQMEADALIAATWETTRGRRRKWYALTEAGHDSFKHDAAGWSASIARLQAVVLPAVRRSAARRVVEQSPMPRKISTTETAGSNEWVYSASERHLHSRPPHPDSAPE